MQNVVDNPAIILSDDLFIGQGASRKCYQHPKNPDKCVKVALDSEGEHHNQYELQAYAVLKGELTDYIVEYDEALVETDQGPGLVCGLLKDADGRISQSLMEYMEHNTLSDDLKRQIDDFFSLLLSRKLNFYDFNVKNFIIQKKAEGERLVYIDIKGYNRTKSRLKLEDLFPPVGRRKMKRRMARFYGYIGLLPG
jgi:hypothetical protein